MTANDTKRAKKSLVFYAHLLSQKGLSHACFGNISMRLKDKIVIKKRGVNLEFARPSDFSVFPLNQDFNSIMGKNILSSEWKMHLLAYLYNPNYSVIFHLHPFYVSLLDRLNIVFKSNDLELKFLLKDKIKILPELEPGSDALAQKVAQSLKEFPCLILKNHGLVVAGQNLEAVYNYALTIEVAAKKLFYLSLFDKYHIKVV